MGIEHVFVVYDPAKPTTRFDLGFRKAVTKIELMHYQPFRGEEEPDFGTHQADAVTAAAAAAEATAAAQAAADAAAAQAAANAAALQAAADADAAAAALRPAIQTFTASHGTHDNVTALTVDLGTTVSFTCQFTNGYGEILLNGAAVTNHIAGNTTVNVDALGANSYTLRVTALNGTTATSSAIVIQTTVPGPVINSFDGGTMTQYVGHVTLVPNFSNGQGWLQQHLFGAFPNWSNTYSVVSSGQSIVVSPSATVDYTLKVTSNHSTSDHGPLSVTKTVTVAVTPDSLSHALTIAGGSTHTWRYNLGTSQTFDLIWTAGADPGNFTNYEFGFVLVTSPGDYLGSSRAHQAFPVEDSAGVQRRFSLPAAPTYSRTFSVSGFTNMPRSRWVDAYSAHLDFVFTFELHLYGILTDGVSRSASLAHVRVNITAS